MKNEWAFTDNFNIRSYSQQEFLIILIVKKVQLDLNSVRMPNGIQVVNGVKETLFLKSNKGRLNSKVLGFCLSYKKQTYRRITSYTYESANNFSGRE